MRNLTEAQIKKLKYTGGRYTRYLVGGTPHLYVFVKADGARDYRYVSRTGAATKIASIETPLKDVRALALKFGEEAKSEQKKAAAKFETFARNWLKIKRSSVAPSTIKVLEARLNRYVLPLLRERDIDEIRKKEIIDLLTRTNEICGKLNENCLEVPKRVLIILNQIFDYAVDLDAIESNPCPKNVSFLGTDLQNRHLRGILDKQRLAEFLTAIKNARAFPPMKYHLYLQLLTALRPANLRNLKWSQICDEDGLKIINIPAEEMKMKRPHKEALSDLALRILRAQKPYSSGEFVFDGINGAKKLTENSLKFFLKKIGFYNEFTPHGSRAMFRTICAEYRDRHGVDVEVLEKVLAHTLSSVREAYNRSYQLPQQKIVLDWYANFLNNLCEFDIYDF